MEKRSPARRLAELIEALEAAPAQAADKARRELKRLTGRDYGPSPGPWREWWKGHANLRCNQCGRPLFDQKLYYLVKARVTSEPTEVCFSEEELREDLSGELERLAARVKDSSAQEAEDEVFVLLDYYLCRPCKLAFVRKVRGGPG